MITEIAIFDTNSGDEEKFIAGYKAGINLIAQTEGYIGHSLRQSHETPTRFVLNIDWETIEAHMEGFRDSERFNQWRGHIGPFLAQPPVVEHFTLVD